MSAISSPTTSPTAPRRRRRGGERRSPPAPVHTLGNGASPEAGRRAAAILEVLAGQRTPREVAQALGISLPYFYLLERKALGGLLQACEQRPKGPSGPGLEEQLRKVEQRLVRAERECQRMAALVRVTQQAVGLPAPKGTDTSPPRGGSSSPGKGGVAAASSGKTRRRRRPVVRALRAARAVRENSSGPPTASGIEPCPTVPAGPDAREPAGRFPGPEHKEVAHGG